MMTKKKDFKCNSIYFANRANIRHTIVRDVIRKTQGKQEALYFQFHRRKGTCPKTYYTFGLDGLIFLVKKIFLTQMWEDFSITKVKFLEAFPFLEAALEHVPEHYESAITAIKRDKKRKAQDRLAAKSRGEIVF